MKKDSVILISGEKAVHTSPFLRCPLKPVDPERTSHDSQAIHCEGGQNVILPEILTPPLTVSIPPCGIL